jgi:hypothetical protein
MTFLKLLAAAIFFLVGPVLAQETKGYIDRMTLTSSMDYIKVDFYAYKAYGWKPDISDPKNAYAYRKELSLGGTINSINIYGLNYDQSLERCRAFCEAFGQQKVFGVDSPLYINWVKIYLQ